MLAFASLVVVPSGSQAAPPELAGPELELLAAGSGCSLCSCSEEKAALGLATASLVGAAFAPAWLVVAIPSAILAYKAMHECEEGDS
jgi:hypothetical protein